MGDAPEIKVKLTAEDTGVASAIKELGNQLKTLKKTQDETASSGINLAHAFDAIASAAAVLGLARIGREAFDSAVNIGKLSDKTGLTTETLSVFHKVADDVGASTDNVDKGLLRAAKSITEFQSGSLKAAIGFKALNLTTKDFIGLSPDQKLQLVTSRIGGLAKSFQKSTAEAQIFGRGASDLIVVANALAAQGFDKASEATSRLGLLLTQDMTDSARAAKASLEELEGAGKGLATQFETGVLPAISDVTDAILDSVDIGKKSGDGFREMGKVAGTVVRGIAAGFILMGTSIAAEIEVTERIFTEAFAEIKIRGVSVYEALSLAVKGHFSEAKAIYDAGSRDIQRAQTELAGQQKAIWDDAAVHIQKSMADLFPSDAEEAKRQRDRVARLRPEDQREAAEPTPPTPPSDAAARAALALLEKQLQDEIAIRRAYASQAEEIDKEQFDRGELTLTEYYNRRRARIQAETSDEIEILKQGLLGAQDEVARAAAAKANAATPKDADRQEAARLAALGKVDELQTKISEAEINSTTKIKQLDDEQFKAKQENQAAVLEFEKEIDTSAGKRVEAAKQEIEIEKQKLQIILEQKGESEAQISEQLARYEQIKLAEASFQDLQKQGEAQLKALDDQKEAINEKVARGQLFTIQAQDQIRQLEASRLPVLEQIAAQLKAQADASGREEDKAAAAQFSKQVQQAAPAITQTQTQMAQLRSTLEGSLVSGFTNFFETVGRGTQSIAQSFEQLAGSVIGSLAKMTAQMLAQIIVAKLLKAALGGAGGFAGGGLVPIPGHAEGGLIKGPGGPKADAIPARLSAGEYVVKADAVSAFGVHNLEAINRGLRVPAFESLALPKFAEGGLVGSPGAAGASGDIRLGIGLDKGLILQHLSSRDAGRIILDHLTNNPKAASKALGRSQG